MPRRNGHIRFDRHGQDATRKGKGKKRRRDWHHAAGSDAANFDPLTIRDMGTGADPTLAAPQPLRGKSTKTTRHG
jgi:hypothetical protein